MGQSEFEKHTSMLFTANMISIGENTELELARLVLLRSKFARDYLKCQEKSNQSTLMENVESVNSQIKKLLFIP